MTLSAYIVKALYEDDFKSLTLADIIDRSRTFTRQWWLENRDVSRLAEANFEQFTGLSFSAHADAIMNGYADHYAEKAFASGHHVEELLSILDRITFRPEDKKTLQDQLASRTVLCLTSHFGGVDLLPVSLSRKGLPSSVFLRFKSDIARERAMAQLATLQQWLDFELLDADASLKRHILQMSKKPRILVTVVDSFKNWRRGLEGRQEEDFLGHRFGLDDTPDKLAQVFKAAVYFIYMNRIRPGEYEIRMEPFSPDETGYRRPLFKRWQELVRSCPGQWYAWEEIHWIWTLDPHSPDSEVPDDST